MPKLKTHKGMKKRFKISATGKVSHKRCGSSHLMSHKSGKRVRRLRKSTTLKVAAEAHRIRNAMLEKQNVNPVHVATLKHEAVARACRSGPTPPARPASAIEARLIAGRARDSSCRCSSSGADCRECRPCRCASPVSF